MNKLQKRLANVAAGGALVLSGAAGAWTMTGIAGAQDTTAATATTAAAQPGETSAKASDGTKASDDSKATDDKAAGDKAAGDKAAGDKPEGCPGPGKGGDRPRPPHPDNGMKEELPTGDKAENVTKAVEAELPGATIDRMETNADGSAYEAHVTDADGKHVTVKLDKDFKVTGTEEAPRPPRQQPGS